MNIWLETEKHLIEFIKDGKEKIANGNYYFNKEFDEYMVNHWSKRLKKISKIKIEDETNPIFYTEFCMAERFGHKATFSLKDVRKVELENVLKTITNWNC